MCVAVLSSNFTYSQAETLWNPSSSFEFGVESYAKPACKFHRIIKLLTPAISQQARDARAVSGSFTWCRSRSVYSVIRSPIFLNRRSHTLLEDTRWQAWLMKRTLRRKLFTTFHCTSGPVSQCLFLRLKVVVVKLLWWLNSAPFWLHDVTGF